MSETASQPGTTPSGEPGSDPAATGAGAPAATPEGFVPLGEAEAAREEARRATQAASDLRKELERLKATHTPAAPTPAPGDSGFDPDGFKQALLRDVYGATQMSQTAATLKAEFPHADPSLFAPEKLSQFGSPEAFRFEVEDSHRRVAAILATERAAIEAKVREEVAAAVGGTAGAAGTPPVPGGDPTPAQVAAMTPEEMDALEASNPGVLLRVLKAASG